MVASTIQHSAAAAADFLILNFGIMEVMVVRSLDFADCPFPESVTAKLKKSKIWFRGMGIIITASAKYKNVKYKRLTVYE